MQGSALYKINDKSLLPDDDPVDNVKLDDNLNAKDDKNQVYIIKLFI